MNQNQNRDFFEDFLREATENFAMRPSRRVWFSIYNNLHPSKKLPSFGTTLIIFCCLLFISTPHHFIFKGGQKNTLSAVSINDIQQSLISKSNLKSNKITSVEKEKKSLQTNASKAENVQSFKIHQHSFLKSYASSNNIPSCNLNPTVHAEAKQLSEVSIPVDINENDLKENNDIVLLKSYNINSSLLKKDIIYTENQQADLIDKTTAKAGNYSFQFYATPSYGYRSMNRKTDEVLIPSSFIGNAGPVEETFTFHHVPAFNLEAGGIILLPLNSELRVKAGMQFNYTNYQIQGDKLPYSFYTNLQVLSPEGFSMLEGYPTHVANSSNINPGGNLFNSSSFQISLPIGTDLKLLGNRDWEWFAGATIQPSYIMGNNPYLLSADMKSYINDPSFMRRWNVNTSLETFLAYRLKNGTMLNAGPQFRYQLFSTYESRYLYSEKLYNIGIKLGLTKDF